MHKDFFNATTVGTLRLTKVKDIIQLARDDKSSFFRFVSGIMRGIRTWIIVANSQHARVLERVGLNNDGHTVMTLDQDSGAKDERSRDKTQGRVHESIGSERHRLEPSSTAKNIQQEHFAKSLADLIEKYASKNRFDRLIIISASAMLGSLRKVLGRRTRELISKEIDKDILSFTDTDAT